MQRIEKESRAVHQNFHHFPSIDKSLENVTDTSPGTCDAFQPLYQNPNGQSGSVSGNPGKNGGCGSCDTLEDVRKEHFLKGLDAGKADACQIVEQELQAPVSQFLNENDKFENCFNHITDKYANQIPALALAIAKKILGDGLTLTAEDLEPICGRLQDLLVQQYRLSMRFNSQEITSLTRILACARPQWQSSTALNIMDDSEIQKGQKQGDQSVQSNEGLIKSFLQEIETLIPAD